MEFRSFKDLGMFEDPDMESIDEDGEGEHLPHDTRSVGEWGLQVRALRDWIINEILSKLWTTTVRPVRLESEPGTYSIAGEPEEILRTYQQRPALFPNAVIERVKAWERKHGFDLFGRTWRERPVRRIPGGVYPGALEDRSLITDANGMVLCIIGVPGWEDKVLDTTGLLGKPGLLFRWMSPDVPVDSYDEYHVYCIRFRTMTVIRRVRASEGPALLARLRRVHKRSRLNLVPWTFDGERQVAWIEGERPEAIARCKVEWHWRLATAPRIVEDEDLAQLRTRLAELEDLMAIQTLDVETGEIVRIGTAYDANADPEIPLELEPTGTSVPTMPALDPYAVHMYRTQENRTLRENTEPRYQLATSHPHRYKPDFNRDWVKVWDFGYPEHDVDDIAPGGGFFPEPGEYEPDATPAYSYHVRDRDLPDEVAINVARVVLASRFESARLGDNRNDDPIAAWRKWRLELAWDVELSYMTIERVGDRWKVTGGYWRTVRRRAAVSWPRFHDALAWLVDRGQCDLAIERDRRVDATRPGVLVKPARQDHHPELPGRMPKWAADQRLWINTESEGMATKARVFGVPVVAPDCDRLMRGMPLALYQVGFVTRENTAGGSFTVWKLARDAKPIQKAWVKATIRLTRSLCLEIGLDPEKVKRLREPRLEFSIMNELPARMLVGRALAGYRMNVRPVVQKGCGTPEPDPKAMTFGVMHHILVSLRKGVALCA
jgi:hypothetical protein